MIEDSIYIEKKIIPVHNRKKLKEMSINLNSVEQKKISNLIYCSDSRAVSGDGGGYKN